MRPVNSRARILNLVLWAPKLDAFHQQSTREKEPLTLKTFVLDFNILFPNISQIQLINFMFLFINPYFPKLWSAVGSENICEFYNKTFTYLILVFYKHL